MESAGKRKQSDNKANDAKKPRRSCLAKRTSTINVKRDPTEPIIKLKRSRVSFAPKEAVKEFSSYYSSTSSSLTSDLDPSVLLHSFEAEKENKTTQNMSLEGTKDVFDQPNLSISPLNSTLGLMHRSEISVDASGEEGSINTRRFFPTEPKKSVNVAESSEIIKERTPKKRRSLLEQVHQRNLFRRSVEVDEDDSFKMNNSKFQKDVWKLFNNSPSSSDVRGRVNDSFQNPKVLDDTLDFLEQPDIMGNDDDTLMVEPTVAMEQTMDVKKTLRIDKAIGLDQTANVDQTMALEQTMNMDKTMNQTVNMEQTMNMDKTMNRTVNMEQTMALEQTMAFENTMNMDQTAAQVQRTTPISDEYSNIDDTMDFIAMEKSVHESSRPATPLAPLTPLNKLRRSLSAASDRVVMEVEDIVPNFTPPSMRHIDFLDDVREVKAPGTPDLSTTKPRKKLMRARDSIGVAKYHMHQKVRRETLDDSAIKMSNMTNDDTGTSTRPLTKTQTINNIISTMSPVTRSQTINNLVNTRSPALATRSQTINNLTGTRSQTISNVTGTKSQSRTPVQEVLRQKRVSKNESVNQSITLPTPSLTPRPRGPTSIPLPKVDDCLNNTSLNLTFSDSGNSFPGNEEFLTMDQTCGVIPKNNTANMFESNRIYDDSLSNSLDKKTFNFTVSKFAKDTSLYDPKEEVKTGSLDHEATNAAFQNCIDEAKAIPSDNFESLGELVEEVTENAAKRLEYYQIVKPKLQYDEYTVKRLSKELNKLKLTSENWAELAEYESNHGSMDISQLAEVSKLLLEQKYYNVTVQVLETYNKTCPDAPQLILDTVGKLEKCELERQRNREQHRANIEFIEAATADIKKYKQQTDTFKNLEAQYHSEEAKLTDVNEKLIEINDQISNLTSNKEENHVEDELKKIAAEFECIRVKCKLYFLGGRIFYDLNEDKFFINGHLRKLPNPFLILLSAASDTQKLHGVFLQSLITRVNEMESFLEKVAFIKSENLKFIRFAKQIVISKTALGNGCYLEHTDDVCSISFMTVSKLGECVNISWKVDISSYSSIGYDVTSYFPSKSIDENIVVAIKNVLQLHGSSDDVNYYSNCIRAVEELPDMMTS